MASAAPVLPEHTSSYDGLFTRDAAYPETTAVTPLSLSKIASVHKRPSDRINRRPNTADFFCCITTGRPYKKLVLSNRGREMPESSLELLQFSGSNVGAKGTSWTTSRCRLSR